MPQKNSLTLLSIKKREQRCDLLILRYWKKNKQGVWKGEKCYRWLCPSKGKGLKPRETGVTTKRQETCCLLYRANQI